MTGTPTAGSTLACIVSWYDDPTAGDVTGVTDSAGNTYTQAGTPVRLNGFAVDTWYCLNALSAASLVATATFELSTSRVGVIAVVEITKSGGEDSHVLDTVGGRSQSGSPPSPISTGDLGTTDVPCFVLAYCRNGSWPDDFNAGTGYTNLGGLLGQQFDGGGWSHGRIIYKIQSSAEAVEAVWTITGGGSSEWLSKAIAIGRPPGAPPVYAPFRRRR